MSDRVIERGKLGGFYDLAYRAAHEGERCNWEGDQAACACGRKGFAVLHLNSWVYEDEEFPFLKVSNELCLCGKHILELVSDLICLGDIRDDSEPFR